MKRQKPEIESVQFNYVGTLDQFELFLKRLVQDYLAVDDPFTKIKDDSVALVESTAV